MGKAWYRWAIQTSYAFLRQLLLGNLGKILQKWQKISKIHNEKWNKIIIKVDHTFGLIRNQLAK